jgi:two-component sensor histidine kinase
LSFICLEFRNDGEDYPEEVMALKRRNLGLYLIDTLVKRDRLGTLTLHNDHGPVTTVRFKRE